MKINTTVVPDTDLSCTASTLLVAIGSATNFHFVAKNVTVIEPEGTVDKLDLLGKTGNFQNMEFDEKPWALASITGTILQSGDEVLETAAFGTGTSISMSFTRFQAGDGNRPSGVAILVNLADGTERVSILLNNAKITKLGDRKLSGADGHWEQDFEAVCKPKDFWLEFAN